MKNHERAANIALLGECTHSFEGQSNGMLDDWEENVAIITGNRTKGDDLVLIHLGDCLWKERGEINAAHTCYLVADANFEAYSDSARLCLIGADHWKCPRTYDSPEAIQVCCVTGLTLAPFVIKVDPNLNVILTACLTVYVGCYRSVKPTPPSETMSNEHAMRFPLVGSAMLLSLFLLFKFLSKDLVNAVLTCYFFVLGIIALSATLLPAIKRFLPNYWNEDLIIWRAPYFQSASVEFTRSQIIASIPGAIFCVWYASQKHWLANNVLGIAFCIQGIEMLSLGSFKTGGILLAGLFVYDIFWVFFTPVMVSVAKSFDAPIKLLFPTSDSTRPFSMLGLGDIVLPGIFVALALRFDVSSGKGCRYFNGAFFGYTLGLVLTIVVMNWLQPALLYIVPGVIGSVAVHCLWNGEVKALLEYNESESETEEAKSGTETSTSSVQDGDAKKVD